MVTRCTAPCCPQEMLDCWQVAGASAPINFAFMFEGEEENGSIGFREAVASNLGWFADAALVVISNTVWVGEKQPCLTYGMRGMITASIQVGHPCVTLPLLVCCLQDQQCVCGCAWHGLREVRACGRASQGLALFPRSQAQRRWKRGCVCSGPYVVVCESGTCMLPTRGWHSSLVAHHHPCVQQVGLARVLLNLTTPHPHCAFSRTHLCGPRCLARIVTCTAAMTAACLMSPWWTWLSWWPPSRPLGGASRCRAFTTRWVWGYLGGCCLLRPAGGRTSVCCVVWLGDRRCLFCGPVAAAAPEAQQP
jgi:hypothetical protein